MPRDRKTGQTKGTGYVNFKTEDAANLALKLNGIEILNRPIRVQPCLSGEKKQDKNKREMKKRDRSDEVEDNKPMKKLKNNLGKPVINKVSAYTFARLFFVIASVFRLPRTILKREIIDRHCISFYSPRSLERSSIRIRRKIVKENRRPIRVKKPMSRTKGTRIVTS